MKPFLLYGQECFTGKYATRKIHKKLHPGSAWFIFHNLTREFINDVSSVISLRNLCFMLSMSFCPYNKKNITLLQKGYVSRGNTFELLEAQRMFPRAGVNNLPLVA